MELTKRMRMNADLVPAGAKAADIGCDHGYVSIYLAEHKMCRVIAMDVREGPLAAARKNIGLAGMENIIECRLSDGLTALAPGEVDTVLIAGMGGMLIRDILRDGKQILSQITTLVLQPQSDWQVVRKTVFELGFCIDKESFCTDAGKNYIAMRARTDRGKKEHPYSEAEWMFGRYLPTKKDADYIDYLEHERLKYAAIKKQLEKEQSPGLKQRIYELSHRLDLLEEILKQGR
jgi:tRNA (adenine22-N1)-methyltransferase